MRSPVRILCVATALLAGSCSVTGATSNVGAADAGAAAACAGVEELVRAGGAGLPPTELRERAGEIYQAASTSANPILRARAAAVLADAAQASLVGDAPNLQSNLSALRQACA